MLRFAPRWSLSYSFNDQLSSTTTNNRYSQASQDEGSSYKSICSLIFSVPLNLQKHMKDRVEPLSQVEPCELRVRVKYMGKPLEKVSETKKRTITQSRQRDFVVKLTTPLNFTRFARVVAAFAMSLHWLGSMR